MAEKKGGIGAAIGAVLVLLIFVGLVGALVWGMFHGGSSELSKALLPPAIALVVSVITLGVSKSYDINTAIKKELRERKVPIYQEIVKGPTPTISSRTLPPPRARAIRPRGSA